MNKAILNYFVDIGLTICFLIVAFTGILKFPKLLPALGISYRSLPMATFSTMHDWAGITMVVLVFIHIVLHWNWIVAMTKKIFGRKQ